MTSAPGTRDRVFSSFREVLRLGAEIVEIEESFGWPGALVGYGIPIVERLHGPHVFGRDQVEILEQKIIGDQREAAELASFTRVQAVTCPSRLMLDEVLRRYNSTYRLLAPFPNPMPMVPAKSAWNIRRANPLQVLCVGRFDLRKGADIVVRAFARAHEQMPSLTLVMAGPDRGLAQFDGTTIHFDEFVAREISPKAREAITFLAPNPRRRLPICGGGLGSPWSGPVSNIRLHHRRSDEHGNARLATDIWGPCELIRDEIDGRLTPVGDFEDMAQKMVAMAVTRLGSSKWVVLLMHGRLICFHQSASPVETVEIYRQRSRP